MENKDILKALKKPFQNIHWRIGSKSKDNTKARFLAYIDARDVMERLDEVVGAENWQNEFEKMDCTNTIVDWKKENREGSSYPVKIVNKVDYEKYTIMQCKLSIFINDKWISKTDGAGARATETEKSLQSDALKRAAVLWGIGRYLYDVKSFYVDLGNKWNDFSTYKDLPQNSQDILKKCLQNAENGIYELVTDNETEPAINKYYKAILDNKFQLLKNGETIVFNIEGTAENYKANITEKKYNNIDYKEYSYKIDSLNEYVILRDWKIEDNLNLTEEKAIKSANKFLENN